MHVEQSKLSLIDLGSCTRERTKINTEVCLLDLGNVIMAKLNGHKHVSNKYVNKIFHLHTEIKYMHRKSCYEQAIHSLVFN